MTQETGWVNIPDESGLYEVQENVFSGAFRHRLFRPDVMFHEWFDGKPTFYPIKSK